MRNKKGPATGKAHRTAGGCSTGPSRDGLEGTGRSQTEPASGKLDRFARSEPAHHRPLTPRAMRREGSEGSGESYAAVPMYCASKEGFV